MAAAAEAAGGEDLALDLVGVLGEHLHVDLPVVQKHHVAHADVVDEVGIVHIHRMDFLADLPAHRERELLPWQQFQRHGQVAGADGRTLRVHEDADGHVAFLGGVTQILDHAAGPVVGRVGHVEPRDVHAGVEHFADHLGGTGGRPERGDDFGFAHKALRPMHDRGAPSR